MAYSTENPIDTMRQTISNFNTAPDLDCLSRIREQSSFTHESQQMRLAQQSHVSQKLLRRLEDYRRRYNDEREGHDIALHHATIDELEGRKWNTAKMASKLETEVEKLAGEVRGLKGKLEEMSCDVERGDGRRSRVGVPDHDDTILKLSVYRSMGVHAELDQDSGEYTRAIIRDSHNRDVHILDLRSSHTDTYHSDRVWDSLPG